MAEFKIKKHFLLLFAGILISFSCFSQVDSSGAVQFTPHNMIAAEPPPPEEIFYKGSVEGGGGVAVPITNKALRASLGGVYYLHFSGHYVLAPHIFGGLEIEDMQLGNTTPNAVYNTLMSIYNLGVKVGYYTYMQNDFLFCYSLSGGPSVVIYRNTKKSAPRQQSFFVTPDILASYRVNNELRIGVSFSVVLSGVHFDPAYTGIDQYVNGMYTAPKDISAITTCLGIGFGMYWAFDEAKQ